MKHLEIALSQIGIAERKGKYDNPEILKYFTEIGFEGSHIKDETAWCSAYLNWVMKKAGLLHTGRLTARSWLDLPNQVDKPKLGDIVIFWRQSIDSWKGHVGLYINETDQYIRVLGGNQGNKVAISLYPKYRLLGYRRPIYDPVEAPNIKLNSINVVDQVDDELVVEFTFNNNTKLVSKVNDLNDLIEPINQGFDKILNQIFNENKYKLDTN